MKKTSLILTFILAPITYCLSQNYQCVYEGGEFDYIDQANNIKAIRIDSVTTIGTNIYYHNFCTIRLSTEFPWCYSPYSASWIGKYVVVDPDGYNYFFNIDEDTIKINTLAVLNENWICYRFDNNDYVEATVVSIDTLSFIGITDTVKTIQFQAKDGSGNPMSHPVNDYQLKLSKEHGLIQLVNFIVFPDLWTSWPNEDYLESFMLCGMSNPQIGRTNITFREVIDYDVGDEFHISEYFHASNSPPYYVTDNILAILKVIDKMNSPGEDTVFYTYHRIMSHSRESTDTSFVDIYNDTIVETINFNSQEAIDFSYLPDESVIPGNDIGIYFMRMIKPDVANGRTEKIASSTGWYGFYEDTCWTEISWDGCFPDYEYIQGCGGPYYWCVFGFNEERRQLLFFQKGEEIWGTPLDPSVILGIDNTMLDGECHVTIVPNPMHNEAVIKIEDGTDFPYLIEFYDVLGNRLAEMDVPSVSTPLPGTILKPGIYIYTLTGQHGSVISGKLIVQ
ncbi:MAG: T9SS type A sorting domain-containing protein [Bacteroidetes bacterium]|nr:T9SS type A sorting domain-containing protein [Bacteroidota bacterium]